MAQRRHNDGLTANTLSNHGLPGGTKPRMLSDDIVNLSLIDFDDHHPNYRAASHHGASGKRLKIPRRRFEREVRELFLEQRAHATKNPRQFAVRERTGA